MSNAREVARWAWIQGHGSPDGRLGQQYAHPEGTAAGSWKAPPRDWLARRLEALTSTTGGTVTTVPLFIELTAGLGSVSLRLQGGPHCRPPVSRMGNKAGYAGAILEVLGLRSGQGAEAFLWCEPDDGCRALLQAYPQPEVLREAAEIIRSWADEDPRELWERLKAEGPIRGASGGEVARWVWIKGRQINGADGGFKAERSIGVEQSNARAVSHEDAVAIGREIRRAREAAGLSRAAVDRALGLNTACSWWEGRNYKGRKITRPPSLPVWRRLCDLLPALDCAWTETLTPTPGAWESKLPGPADFADRLNSLAASEVARWARITTSNRLINLDPQTWKNTGNGGSKHGGEDFSTGAEKLARGFEPAASTWPPVTVCADAREVDPGTLPEGTVAYMDPPYQGTTGYGNDLPRAEVVELARRWADAGAIVCISEAEALPTLMADGWHSVEITGCRKGQKRTFSAQQREFLTLNRAPAWRPSTTLDLFGGK